VVDPTDKAYHGPKPVFGRRSKTSQTDGSGRNMASVDKQTQPMKAATVRFAGDSGDGMQLAGMRFTDASAIFGNDVATLPDFPAEIRAPAGTVAGVSGFQINFASEEIHTPGDAVDALIAMNPAAFKANIVDVRSGGIVVVNESEFTKVNLRKAGYDEGYNPIVDEVITAKYKVFAVPITRLTEDALKDTGLGAKDIGRCKNMYALGLMYWLYDRPLEPTIDFLNDFFGVKKGKQEIADANVRVLRAGYDFGDTTEMILHRYEVDKATIQPGRYRRITGNEALAIGLVAASKLADLDLIYASYPITPASDVLHYLAAMKNYGVKTVQAEDEIAAVCAAIGSSFAGQLAVTGTSGPGLCLKAEAVGLAVMAELPMIIVNVQRGGPSTGLPTKVEQSDLLQSMFGRNGDSPVVVISCSSPGDCFEVAVEAARIALRARVPVVLLSDGYVANGAEPWPVPDVDSLEKIELPTLPSREGVEEPFEPYRRNEDLARPWAVPGMPGYEHRVGGLEKAHNTGNVSYIPENHQKMTDLRHAKVAKVADYIPELEVDGPDQGDLLVLGWGGTYGAITTATRRARAAGRSIASAHLRYLNPFPKNLGDVLKSYKHVLIPELNTGQLSMLIRGKFLVDARGLNKVAGQPFLIDEIAQAIDLMMDGEWPADRISLSPQGHEVLAEPAELQATV
jgi:2-oxoglutarate ferredoxin oxidoreductase subunit alpha